MPRTKAYSADQISFFSFFFSLSLCVCVFIHLRISRSVRASRLPLLRAVFSVNKILEWRSIYHACMHINLCVEDIDNGIVGCVGGPLKSPPHTVVVLNESNERKER
jgi:hypothetical protein